MGQPTLFSEAELSILRKACFDAQAVRRYDLWSGGFYWSDEGIIELAGASDSYLYRYLIRHRASISEATVIEQFELWEQLLVACPNWPGFRSERNGPSLAYDLELAAKAAKASLHGME